MERGTPSYKERVWRGEHLAIFGGDGWYCVLYSRSFRMVTSSNWYTARSSQTKVCVRGPPHALLTSLLSSLPDITYRFVDLIHVMSDGSALENTQEYTETENSKLCHYESRPHPITHDCIA